MFSPNEGKYEPEKLRIRTLFMQCQEAALEISKLHLDIVLNKNPFTNLTSNGTLSELGGVFSDTINT